MITEIKKRGKKMKTYLINELNGYAWECGIRNTISRINIAGVKHGICYTFKDDSALVESLASSLKLKFDENGNII